MVFTAVESSCHYTAHYKARFTKSTNGTLGTPNQFVAKLGALRSIRGHSYHIKFRNTALLANYYLPHTFMTESEMRALFGVDRAKEREKVLFFCLNGLDRWWHYCVKYDAMKRIDI